MIYDITQFTCTDGNLCAEASDFGRALPFDRLYDDAADEGMFIRSRKTGKVAAFVVAEEHRDADDDITHWTLKPVAPHPSLMHRADAKPTCRVTIFND